jgi:hypothetical protein
MNFARALRTRNAGFALPMALAVVVLLAAIAALSSIAARAALRESIALSEEAQAAQSRAALRARAERQLSAVPHGELLVSALALGAGDTLLSVLALAWPWHRVSVSAGGLPVVAEFARGLLPGVPWCNASVSGGAASVAPGTLSNAPGNSCPSLLVVAPSAEIAAFDDSLRTQLVLPAPPDTLIVSSNAAGAVVLRARRRIDVVSGGSVSGVLVAPIVCVAAGGIARGIVVARDSLIVRAGGALVGDSAVVRSALTFFSRLLPAGRAGLLLPP